MLRYFTNLSSGKIALWCFLIWYLATVFFSQLIKGKGFVLVFPPDARELAVSLAACALFVIGVLAIRRSVRSASSRP